MKVIPVKIPNIKASKPCFVDDEIYDEVSKYKWRINRGGYATRTVYKLGNKTGQLLLHQLVAKAPNGFVTDHINGNKLDNRKDNLRYATFADNIHNRGVSKRNTSGYKGVRRYKNKFIAAIRFGGRGAKEKYLGIFDTQEEASNAYKSVAKKLHGEFVRLTP